MSVAFLSFGRAVAPLARPNAAASAARPAAAAAAASEARRGAGGALGAGLGICAALAQAATGRGRSRRLLHGSRVAMGGSIRMISKEEALPGRQEELRISEKHYVLGTPMKGPWPEGHDMFVFANGCFWGSEKGIWRLPGGGVYSTAVGYAGGFTANPTYEEACSGRTGHTEAVQVVFDPSKIGLVDILRWFWEAHDPTQGMGQGNDRGTQYRSGLYYFNEDQKRLFEASKVAYEAALQGANRGRGPITTEILASADFEDKVFYYAEDYHQQYLAKPRARPYCSAQPQVVPLPSFESWCPEDLQEKYRPKLPEEFWQQHGPSPHCVIMAPNEPILWP
ncbi:unnamed protein product [Effrenium voratum]|uniref:peptide-methionine (S)-S-oxide reductase n=1 Tax=Effrenium voratum TaxID=2562239 RepID=A0AA36NCN8_9DINO|nr:unnamed protein product [Effrenium voratum]CAJ1456862.1 unnamed protein product [Effrenium voratum]